MTPVRAVFRREFASYFATPLAAVFLVIFLALAGAFTFYLGGFYEAGQADLQPFFRFHPWLYLLLAPAVAMRLWAEERKSGTLELLLRLPLASWQAVLGKFLAAWAFLGVALMLTFPLLVGIAGAIALAAAAWWALDARLSPPGAAPADAVVLPGFAARAEAIDRIEVVGAGDASLVVLEKRDGLWRMPSRSKRKWRFPRPGCRFPRSPGMRGNSFSARWERRACCS